MGLREEAARRRTFAIISHPDAGKTTLTEKLLLYANAIELAGSVKARKSARHAVSDWMKMEQERGISITSSVLQFEYEGRALNLLDTPGHADFSEDTYRVLAAVDSAVMLMDHSKGVEPRTRKLFEVCRMRRLPVVTFMNKLDRHGLEPLALVDEVSETLRLRVAPLNWPIGMGSEFRGVVDLRTREALLFEATRHGATAIEARRVPWAEAEPHVGSALYAHACEELALVAEAGDGYSHEGFLAGDLSPLFWGSAMTNFGVRSALDFLAQNAAPPGPRTAQGGQVVEPGSERFSGFVFKIQANMNPKHRDRMAFLRVVSGRFEAGMEVLIGRSGERYRLTRPHSVLASERSIVDEAWPGDIVGLHDSGKLRVGDTLAAGAPLGFEGIPRFAPEHLAQVVLRDPLKRKGLDAGLEQLGHEGVVQLLTRPGEGLKSPFLGAVGLLQFEVLKERLKHEYDVNVTVELVTGKLVRWIGGPREALEWLRARRDYLVLEDRNGRPVLLASSQWWLQHALENAKGLELHEIEPL